MSGKTAVKRCFHHWPTRFLSVVLIILQAASVNWYLMDNLTFTWAAVYGADALVVALFVLAILMSSRNIHKEKHLNPVTVEELQHLPLTYLSWFVYAVVLDVKVTVIFLNFSTDLDEVYFFGPNTLKTSLALSGIVFLTFLPTQHDVKSDHRKPLITSLTATVIFDILDGVDILENLFDEDVRASFPPEMDDAIIAIFCINFLLPTVPLFTLSKTKFALHPLPERFELLHKFAIAYLINLPLFVIRMVTWHGLSQGISIFLLKNLIAMGVVTFELCGHFIYGEKKEANNGDEKNEKKTHPENNVPNTSL